jgi:hypothetical protein
VDLDAAVFCVEWRRLGRDVVIAHVGLDAPEQRVAGGVHRVVMVEVVGRREHELHLARVATPRAQQTVGRERRGRVVLPLHRALRQRRDGIPQPRRRMQEEQVDLAPRGQRLQHVAVAGGHAGQAEDREARRQVEDAAVGLERRTRLLEPLRRCGLTDPCAQAAPQLPLPVVRADLPARPVAHRVRPVQRVPVEQVGDVPHGREPPRALERVVLLRAAEVRGEQVHPRLGQAFVDDLEQRPHRSLRQPRVLVGIDAGRCGHGIPDEPPRGREVDVRAHAVGRTRGRTEPRRELLRDPPLHAAGRDGDDLGRERIVRRRREQRPKRLDEPVGAVGPVEMQHRAEVGA